MARSKTIAGLIGPTLLAVGVALLLNRDVLPSFLQEASREPLLIFMTGVPLLVAGLAIVRNHNVWSGGWPVLVTLFGWLAIAGGLVRILFPAQLAVFVGRVAAASPEPIVGGGLLVIFGAFLTFKSFARD